jgi:hypothetical protein
VPVQPDPAKPLEVRAVKTESAQPGLAARVTAKLNQDGSLTAAYAARSIRMELERELRSVWSRGHISAGDLWSYYCRYPYLTRLRDRSVLDGAVRSVLDSLSWEVEGFALASGFDEASGRYEGLVIPHESGGGFGQVTDSTLLVLPEVARRQWQAERPPEGGPDGGEDPGRAALTMVAGGEGRDGTRPEPGSGSAAPAPENVRFFGSVRLNPERYGRDFTRVAQEVVQHLAAVEGVQLDVKVEVSAVKPDGFPADKVRIVTENARTLKFDQFGFEDE